uniref:Uncharacterized protein n=1 Tax=Onchocerca volvulus TaxID=6282 RepID=A0A8R1Y0M2_ONCVO
MAFRNISNLVFKLPKKRKLNKNNYHFHENGPHVCSSEIDGVDEKECKNVGIDEDTDERSESDVLRVRKRGFQDENNPGIL